MPCSTFQRFWKRLPGVHDEDAEHEMIPCEAPRHRRRRYGVGALALTAACGVVATILSSSSSPLPPRRPVQLSAVATPGGYATSTSNGAGVRSIELAHFLPADIVSLDGMIWLAGVQDDTSGAASARRCGKELGARAHAHRRAPRQRLLASETCNDCLQCIQRLGDLCVELGRVLGRGDPGGATNEQAGPAGTLERAVSAMKDLNVRRFGITFAYPDRTLEHGAVQTRPTKHRYLHGHHEAVLRSHRQRTVENSASYLLPHLRPDAQVLDVGCGPGTITVGLARRVPDGAVIGIDADAGIVEEARSLCEASEQTNVACEVGDVYRLAFDDAAFDVVHAHQVLQHLADPVAAMAEMRRVCKPDGLVACRDADYGAMFWYPASKAMTDWQALYRSVARSAGGEPDAGRHLLAWARAAGFSRVELSASMWCYASADERRWWGDLWAERLTRSRFAEQATSEHLATTADLERLADGWRAWMEENDACFLIPHGEVLCAP